MSSIAWLKTPDSVHNTYGIEILTDDLGLFPEFKGILVNLAKTFSCHYFIQGQKISNISWLYFEFFGEGDQDKILSVVSEFSNFWKDKLYQNEVLFVEPERDLLESLNLF